MRYAYVKPNGEVVWHEQPLGDEPPPTELVVDGEPCKRSYRAERAGVPSTSGWPMTCFASGVHAEQAGELRKTLARAGVPTEVTKDGDPVYTSKRHRDRALKARGLFDKQGYY